MVLKWACKIWLVQKWCEGRHHYYSSTFFFCGDWFWFSYNGQNDKIDLKKTKLTMAVITCENTLASKPWDSQAEFIHYFLLDLRWNVTLPCFPEIRPENRSRIGFCVCIFLSYYGRVDVYSEKKTLWECITMAFSLCIHRPDSKRS